ncbi:MAG: NosD domain-containing protein [bacterium]|nr:NosD domain-containing protein [bacterium]
MKELIRKRIGILAYAITVLILLSMVGAAYSNPLEVLFKAQVPPGTTGTQNCGQTSSLMVFSYYNGTIPTEQGIKDIDDWLNKTYGKKQPINNYNGAATTTSILEVLAKEYGGFTDSYQDKGWTIDKIKQEIDSGHPIIVSITAKYLSNRGYNYADGHFVVVTGYNATHIIVNDPGTSKGSSKYYLNSEFWDAMTCKSAENCNARRAGGSVVVVMPKTPPIPPKQKIVVLSPNGGENWPVESEQKIQWKYTGKQTTSVKIELQKGSSPLLTELIAIFVPTDYNGDGSYLWTIPATHETGTDYKVIVTSMENSKRTDTSDGYFTISAPAPPPTPTPTPTPTPAPTGPVHNVNKNTDYASIQAAINDANTGDEIDVYSGTYYENVNVNKQLTLKGIGNPVVDAHSSGSAITLSADGITLEGFTATNTSSSGAGIWIVSNNNTLFGNNAGPNNHFGIYMAYSSNNMLIGNNVSSNNAHGILMEGGNNNNTLIGNNVSSNNVDGIFLYSSSNNTLIDNNVSNNHRNGIYIWYSSNNNTVNGNSASNNSYGIVLEASIYNKVYQNNLVSNSYNGYDTSSNQWDNGTVGNYYSDYTGIDLNGDGIGNTPYPIPGGSSRDRYPLMNKWQN